MPVLNMDTDYKRTVNRNFDGNTINFVLDKDITRSLKKIAKENNLTMYMLFLSIYTVLLSKYSSQEDIVVGTPTSGRNNYDLQNLIGMFVNTLAIRNYPKANKTFNEYLKDVKENVLRAFENQEYQFEQLIEKIDLEKNPGRNPLFDTMLVLQNIEESTFKFGNLKVLGDRYKNNISKFDFTLTLSEVNNEIKCDLEYSTQLFKKSTMERFAIHFINLIEQVINNMDLMIKDISIIDKNERELIRNIINH